MRPTRGCGTGGYAIRPYGPVFGFLVGAACMAARTGSRFAAGLESSVRRPRVQGIPMTAVGVGRHAHMPPGPGALCSGPRWLRGLVMAGCGHPALRGAFGGGASDAGVRHGRICNPPLRARFRFSRRGGLYGRPNRVPIRGGPREFRPPPPCARYSDDRSGRRAACPHAAGTGCIVFRAPVVAGAGHGGVWAPRPTGCVRRGCVRRGGAARADMKSAPTDPLSVSS